MADEGEGLRQSRCTAGRIGGIGIAATAKFRSEGFCLGVNQFEVHGGIVGTGGLMDIDVKTIVALHLQGSLYASRREDSHAGVAPVDGFLHARTDFREFGLLCLLLLGVVVAGQPPRRVVAGHSELSMFLLDKKIVQLLLLRELVTEADAVVVDAETDGHLALFLLLL